MIFPAATLPSCAWHFTVLQMWEVVKWLRLLPVRSLESWWLGEFNICINDFGTKNEQKYIFDSYIWLGVMKPNLLH